MTNQTNVKRISATAKIKRLHLYHSLSCIFAKKIRIGPAVRLFECFECFLVKNLYYYCLVSCFSQRFFLSIPTSNVLSSPVLPHVSRLTSHALQKKAILIAFHLPKGRHSVAITRFDARRETRDVSKRHGTTGHETQEIA